MRLLPGIGTGGSTYLRFVPAVAERRAGFSPTICLNAHIVQYHINQMRIRVGISPVRLRLDPLPLTRRKVQLVPALLGRKLLHDVVEQIRAVLGPCSVEGARFLLVL